MAAPIIVGIDGSAHAWRALDWAADHAVRRGLPVVLVHGSRALEPGGAIPDDALQRLVAERQALLDEARQYALKLHPGLDIETRLAEPDPGSALVDGSEEAALIRSEERRVGRKGSTLSDANQVTIRS